MSPTAIYYMAGREHALQGTVLATSINAMSQAEGFYLWLSVCICGLKLCQRWDFPAFAGLEEFELELGLDGGEGLA